MPTNVGRALVFPRRHWEGHAGPPSPTRSVAVATSHEGGSGDLARRSFTRLPAMLTAFRRQILSPSERLRETIGVLG